MASGWTSHDREEAQLYPTQQEHHPRPLLTARGHPRAPAALPLGAKGTTWEVWTLSPGPQEAMEGSG